MGTMIRRFRPSSSADLRISNSPDDPLSTGIESDGARHLLMGEHLLQKWCQINAWLDFDLRRLRCF
jgi:hypothetical protein